MQMLRMKIGIIGMLVVLTMHSCKHSRAVLPPFGYMSYMETDYKKKVISGKTEYTVQLATPTYMACREMDGHPEKDKTTFNKRAAEMNGYIYFIIQVKPGSKAIQSPDAMVMYYQSAAKDMTLISGGRTLKPAIWNFENNYGLTPYNTIVAGFEYKGENAEDMQLVFNDNYTHIPMIKIKFSKEEITTIPQLAIN